MHKISILLICFILTVAKENPTLTTAQTAKKITEFWKQLSSEERGYYRDIAHEEEKEQQAHRKKEEKIEISRVNTEKNRSRLLQLFEKMKNTKNEKKEKLNMRTIVPWIIDRARIIERFNSKNNSKPKLLLYICLFINLIII
jgi:membrane-bound lytic murein transglycosylase